MALFIAGSLLAGCGSVEEKDSGIPEELQGHWVDVNGETTLDLDGNRMTVTSPWDRETYKVRITGEDVKYIENESAKGDYDKGFGVMGPVTIGSDGALTAYEQVMDAPGHDFRFVREEDLEKEQEIRIKDRDLPKEIASDDIVSFIMVFGNEDSSYDIPADEFLESGRYTFEIEKKDDGDYEMSFHGSGSSYIITDYDDTVPEEYVKGLAGLIKEQKLAEHNGWWRTNSEQFESWYVNIEYASGEKILMEASGRAALECPFSFYAFLKYADIKADVFDDDN